MNQNQSPLVTTIAICTTWQEYDELVLATGSSPFVPPISGLKTSIPGIFLYRTIEDMDACQLRGNSPVDGRQ